MGYILEDEPTDCKEDLMGIGLLAQVREDRNQNDLILVRTTRWMVVLTEMGRTRRGVGQEGNPALCFEHGNMKSLSSLHLEM